MPGLIVSAVAPPMFTEPCDVPPDGTASMASGSATTAAPVTGLGLRVALPVLLTPPTTWMLAAVTLALPLATSAVLEFESTTTAAGALMIALCESVNAPLAVALRTYIEAEPSITLPLLPRKFVSPP